MSVELTREQTLRTLLDGFLPITRPDDLPARDRRGGLRELGLPYETEPAITKHLAAFLVRAAAADRDPSAGMARPAAVLFNGGFFTPAFARDARARRARVVVRRPPGGARERAPRSGGGGGRRLLRAAPRATRRRRGGCSSGPAARAPTTSVSGTTDGAGAVCVMPRGTQEGTTLALDHTFSVTTNQPVAFTLYSSTGRSDPLNDLVTFADRTTCTGTRRS